MTKQYLFLGYILIIGTLLLSGCIKDNSPSQPAYIYVESIGFEADSSVGQGSSSSAITDAWPSVDGQLLGGNSMPCLYPVILNPNILTNGVRISAGIKKNGIANTRGIYPFYEPKVITLDLEPGQIDTFNVVLNYDPNAEVVVVEDFEDINQPIFTDDIDENLNTEMIHQNNEVFEGNYSGLMVLDSANLDCTVASSTRYFNLQSISATPVYLELNYKTNSPFQVGLIARYSNGTTETIYKGGANASTTWKKIYFELTEEAFGSNAAEYSVIFKALKYVDVAEPKIYLDNIKLLYYP